MEIGLSSVVLRELDSGLAEAVSTLIWAAPRLQSEVAELKIVSRVVWGALHMQGGGDTARNWWKPLSGTLCHLNRGCVFMGSADGHPIIGVPGASGMAKATQLGHSVAEMRTTWGGGCGRL